MYATCLFCHGALGRNEALEHFPIGRRLAFDAARGRLWVVCPTCARWNLSPRETRWEAIEEAERAFGGTRLRASTPNIGLAKLREGTELVRVGRPLVPEFAAWRYGASLLRRRRRETLLAWPSNAVMLLHSALIFGPWSPHIAATMVLGAAMTGAFAHDYTRNYRRTRAPRLLIRTNAGEVLRLSGNDARLAEIGGADDERWSVRVRHRIVEPQAPLRRALRAPPRTHAAPEAVVLEGLAARNALTTLLPSVFIWGASRQEIASALEIVSDRRSLHESMVTRADSTGRSFLRMGKLRVDQLRPEQMVGLEMVLHEEDERRALEGELRELEERWRDAEEIGGISDTLLLPPEVEERLDALRRRG